MVAWWKHATMLWCQNFSAHIHTSHTTVFRDINTPGILPEYRRESCGRVLDHSGVEGADGGTSRCWNVRLAEEGFSKEQQSLGSSVPGLSGGAARHQEDLPRDFSYEWNLILLLFEAHRRASCCAGCASRLWFVGTLGPPCRAHRRSNSRLSSA